MYFCGVEMKKHFSVLQKGNNFNFGWNNGKRPTKPSYVWGCMCECVYARVDGLVSTAKKGFNNSRFYFINGHAHRKCELWWCIWWWWYAIKKLLLYAFLCGSGTHKRGFLDFQPKTNAWTQKLYEQQSRHPLFLSSYFLLSALRHPLSEFYSIYVGAHPSKKNHSQSHTHTPNLPVRSTHTHSFIHSPKSQNSLPYNRISKGNSFSTFGRLATVLVFFQHFIMRSRSHKVIRFLLFAHN